MWTHVSDAPTDAGLSVSVGPERIIFAGGLQPGLFRSAKGTLFVFGSNINGGGVNLVSRNNGQSWERWLPPKPPAEVYGHADNPFNPPPSGQIPSVPCGAYCALRDGRVLALDTWANGPNPSGEFLSHLWVSTDDLASFQRKDIRVRHPRGRAGVDDGGIPCPGLCFCRSLLEMPDGGLLATGYGWCEGDTTPCGYLPSASRSRAMVFRSDDGGHTWRHLSDVAVGPEVGEEGFSELSMTRLTHGPHAGRLLALMRTGSNNCAIWQAHSDDNGATWGGLHALAFGGVFPDVITMADGTLACSFGWRIWGGGEMQNYYVVFSRDGGHTWSHLTLLPLENHAAVPYPCGTWYSGLREIAPGRLIVVYDVGTFRPSWPVKYLATREIEARPQPS